jgi:hypothetical protein
MGVWSDGEDDAQHTAAQLRSGSRKESTAAVQCIHSNTCIGHVLKVKAPHAHTNLGSSLDVNLLVHHTGLLYLWGRQGKLICIKSG